MQNPKTIFKPSLLAISVSAVLLSGCLSSDNDNTPPVEAPPAVTGLTLEFVGRYSSGVFGESAAEITGYDAASRRAFVVNALEGSLNVLDMSDPSAPTLVDTLTVGDIADNAVVNLSLIHI